MRSGIKKIYILVSEMCHFCVLSQNRGRCKKCTNSRICAECVRTISWFVQTATTGLQQRRSSVNNTAQICSKIPPHYCNLFFSFSFLKMWDSNQIAFHLNRNVEKFKAYVMNLGTTMIDEGLTQNAEVARLTHQYTFFKIPDHIIFLPSYSTFSCGLVSSVFIVQSSSEVRTQWTNRFTA